LDEICFIRAEHVTKTNSIFSTHAVLDMKSTWTKIMC